MPDHWTEDDSYAISDWWDTIDLAKRRGRR